MNAAQGRRSQFAILTSVPPLVSIVVPVFNGMPHLRELVKAIQQQTYSNLEFVFTEGGGVDESWQYLSQLDDPRMRLIQMPRGSTAAQNWTAATLAATGEFAKLLCQDDLIYPRAIELQVRDLSENPSAVMAIAQRDIIDARGRVQFRGRGLAGLPKDKRVLPGESVLRACYRQGTNVFGEPLAVLFRTDVLKGAMPWDDTDPLMLDLSTYQKIAPLGDVASRFEAIGAFRVSEASWSTRIAQQQLEQTKRWQDNYAKNQTTAVSMSDRMRAAAGRHISTNQRRAAYTILRLRGSLSAPRVES